MDQHEPAWLPGESVLDLLLFIFAVKTHVFSSLSRFEGVTFLFVFGACTWPPLHAPGGAGASLQAWLWLISTSSMGDEVPFMGDQASSMGDQACSMRDQASL